MDYFNPFEFLGLDPSQDTVEVHEVVAARDQILREIQHSGNEDEKEGPYSLSNMALKAAEELGDPQRLAYHIKLRKSRPLLNFIERPDSQTLANLNLIPEQDRDPGFFTFISPYLVGAANAYLPEVIRNLDVGKLAHFRILSHIIAPSQRAKAFEAAFRIVDEWLVELKDYAQKLQPHEARYLVTVEALSKDRMSLLSGLPDEFQFQRDEYGKQLLLLSKKLGKVSHAYFLLDCAVHLKLSYHLSLQVRKAMIPFVGKRGRGSLWGKFGITAISSL